MKKQKEIFEEQKKILKEILSLIIFILTVINLKAHFYTTFKVNYLLLSAGLLIFAKIRDILINLRISIATLFTLISFRVSTVLIDNVSKVVLNFYYLF